MNNLRGQALIIVIIFIVLVSAALFGYLYLSNRELKSSASKSAPLTWEECLKQPSAIVQESYPGVCRLPDGRTSIQPLSEEEKKKLQPPIADETAKWKTYTNTNSLGLSFKYPDDWVITETDNYVVVIKDPDPRLIVGACPGYSFSISKYDPLMNYARFDAVVKSELDGQSVEVWENKDTNCKESVIFVNQLPSNAIKPRYIISFMSKNPDNNKFLNQILSTFKFLDPAGSSEPVNFYSFSGRLVLNGYFSILERPCAFTEDNSCLVKLAIFTVLTADNPQFSSFLKDLAGNAFATNDGIILGCIDTVGKQINSSNDADTGTVENLISGGQYDLLAGSSPTKPVNLSLEKPKLTGGRGAPDCYSHFRNFKVY